MIFVFGLYAYIKMPGESNPDIQIFVMSVFVRLPGISVKIVRSYNDGAHVILKFGTEYSNKEVLGNVRSKFSNVKSKLPAEAESPVISEMNLSLFPILSWIGWSSTRKDFDRYSV
ncbi:hypothetical protein [Wolbachia endosymbiont of Mansonella ozzardi]|uniref:hypothetical protein n=1 Tax=Wolbachia endosymbiont of Mansonella ozzardi TaxID=137464 RepID=UPI001CE1E68E|nr:hypothetical protein [Wolbachia endosymbiont of Mansonella ozzardi]